MFYSLRLLWLFCFIFATCFSPAAHADGGSIQMLPPVDFGGDGKPCVPGATAGLLYWDGSTAIKCVPGSLGDVAGNLAAKGSVQVGANYAACTSANAGAIRFNASTNAFEGCNGSAWGSLSAGAGSVFANDYCVLDPASTGYCSLTGWMGAATAVEGFDQIVLPRAGTLHSLYAVNNYEAGHVSNGTTTITLRVNGADTPLQVTIPAGTGMGFVTADVVDAVAVSAGDIADYRIDYDGTDHESPAVQLSLVMN